MLVTLVGCNCSRSPITRIGNRGMTNIAFNPGGGVIPDHSLSEVYATERLMASALVRNPASGDTGPLAVTSANLSGRPPADTCDELEALFGDRVAVYLCEEVPAAQAAEWGLVNRAVPEAELDAAIDELVEKLATKLPQTTRYAKQQLNVWRDLAWHQTVGHARDWLALSMLGDEAQDAVRAFLDRGSSE